MTEREPVDVAEPPRIVFESPAKCADGRRAQALLDEALGRARAPAQGWAVTMHVEAAGPGVLRAEGAITDGRGAPVGHRVFERKASDCSGLARAIGVWASLVLDAEMNRPRNVVRAEPPLGPVNQDPAAKSEGGHSVEARPASDELPSDAQSTPAWPLADASDKALADREWQARRDQRDQRDQRDDARAFEIGAGAFLMTGTGVGAVAGLTSFADIEVARSVFVRPALLFGESLPFAGPDVVLFATRVDGCLRVTGLYTSHNGMQLDLCGGTDIGALAIGRTLPYIAAGPSVGLQGEFGGDFAAALRGLFDVNAVHVRGQSHGETLDTPLWAGRVELALSWRLR